MSVVPVEEGNEEIVVVCIKGGSLKITSPTEPGKAYELLDSKKSTVFLKLDDNDHVIEVFLIGKMIDTYAKKLCEKMGKVHVAKVEKVAEKTQPSPGSSTGTDVVPVTTPENGGAPPTSGDANQGSVSS